MLVPNWSYLFFTGTTCLQGKLIIRPSPENFRNESISSFEMNTGWFCGPMHPSWVSLRYFTILLMHQLNGHMFGYYQLDIRHL